MNKRPLARILSGLSISIICLFPPNAIALCLDIVTVQKLWTCSRDAYTDIKRDPRLEASRFSHLSEYAHEAFLKYPIDPGGASAGMFRYALQIDHPNECNLLKNAQSDVLSEESKFKLKRVVARDPKLSAAEKKAYDELSKRKLTPEDKEDLASLCKGIFAGFRSEKTVCPNSKNRGTREDKVISMVCHAMSSPDSIPEPDFKPSFALQSFIEGFNHVDVSISSDCLNQGSAIPGDENMKDLGNSLQRVDKFNEKYGELIKKKRPSKEKSE